MDRSAFDEFMNLGFAKFPVLWCNLNAGKFSVPNKLVHCLDLNAKLLGYSLRREQGR